MTEENINYLNLIDDTNDINVISEVWNITKIRIEEEKRREDSANDRASKYAIITISLLGLNCTILTLVKDLMIKVFLFEIYGKCLISIYIVIGHGH